MKRDCSSKDWKISCDGSMTALSLSSGATTTTLKAHNSLGNVPAFSGAFNYSTTVNLSPTLTFFFIFLTYPWNGQSLPSMQRICRVPSEGQSIDPTFCIVHFRENLLPFITMDAGPEPAKLPLSGACCMLLISCESTLRSYGRVWRLSFGLVAIKSSSLSF